MTYATVITNAISAGAGVRELDDATARAACGYWHDGQGSAFYAFASSGRFDRSALLAELSNTIAASYRNDDSDNDLVLDALGTYLINRRA